VFRKERRRREDQLAVFHLADPACGQGVSKALGVEFKGETAAAAE